MKNILIMAMMTILATLNLQAENSNVENCKAFIKEAQAYKATMKQDNISKATLAFYKDEVVGQCGHISSKMPYDKNYFAKALTRKQTESVYMCKKSIEMAKEYAQTPNKSFLVSQAHKEHVISYCGTLVAKTPSCFFDVIDESKEDKKARCLASVERAKAFQETNSKDIEKVQSHKDEIRANCGSLMAKS